MSISSSMIARRTPQSQRLQSTCSSNHAKCPASSQAFTQCARLQSLAESSAMCTSARSLRTVQTAASTSANGASALPELLPLDESYEERHAFTPYANWILPGRLMVGRYPFIEPSRCHTREQGEAQLRSILEQGITSFISFQAEVPPQHKMRLAGERGFIPYKSTAELIVASMQAPPPMEIIEGLRNPFLDKYLPPRRRTSTAAAWVPKELQLQFAHSGIVDLHVPTMEQLQSIVDDLSKRLRSGENVYAHCWGGRGRVGLVAAALLTQLYNVSAEEALQRVQRAFDTRRDGGRPSPETEEQRQLVFDFVASRTAHAR